MGNTEWNPFEGMDEEMKSFLKNSSFNKYYSISNPKVDVFQTNNDIIIKAEIPGALKKDLNVCVNVSSIKLSGQIKKYEDFGSEHIYKVERRYGDFSRTVHLPVEVVPEKAIAEYNDGILTINVPKAKPGLEEGRRLEVQ